MRNFDELNILSKNETIDINSYFNGMELSEKEKQERKEFAFDTLDNILFVFALFFVMQEYQHTNADFIKSQLQSKYIETVMRHMIIDDYIEGYIEEFSQEMIDTTLKHIGEEFYLSRDRGVLIAVNESNTILNYKDYKMAIEGGCARKQWITEKDERVRKTHRALDDKIIPITDLFLVGNTFMRFPHDTLYGIDYAELSNCRCTICYT